MLQNDTELILLTSWTLKRHTEDVKLFESTLFTRPSWFEAIRNGKNYTQIRSMNLLEGMSIADVVTYADRGFYPEARAEALTEQRNAYMSRAKSNESQRWLDKATEIQSIIDGKDEAPNVTGLKDIFIKDYTERLNENNPQYGIGFKYLDKATKGIHRGQLTTIGARPRVGKSAMALQIAYNVAMQDFKTIYVPLEMSIPEMAERLLKMSQTITATEFDHPNESHVEQMALFLERLEQVGNFIFCTADNMGQIKEKVKAERPYLIVIDQLSLLKADEPYTNNRERIMSCTRGLKRLALDENVAILLMSQINRDGQEKSEPTLESLSESDSIGQDSDNVFLLYTTEEEIKKQSPQRLTMLKIAKQRNGASGQVIPLMYEGERFTFNACEVSK